MDRNDKDLYAAREREQEAAAFMSDPDLFPDRGVREVNHIDPYHRELHNRRLPTVDWTDPELEAVTRFRLLTDPGFPAYDVSYCYGVLFDGQPVNVALPFDQLPKRSWKTFLVEEAKAAGVNAKRLGFFDAVSSLS